MFNLPQAIQTEMRNQGPAGVSQVGQTPPVETGFDLRFGGLGENQVCMIPCCTDTIIYERIQFTSTKYLTLQIIVQYSFNSSISTALSKA